jgi:DNA-directed RNA polymerase II subunit RPB2
MERDCLIAHGSAMFLRERLFLSADRFSVTVCEKCGLMVTGNSAAGIYECRRCGADAEFCSISMPYSAKLLFHELQAMSIFPRLICKD